MLRRVLPAAALSVLLLSACAMAGFPGPAPKPVEPPAAAGPSMMVSAANPHAVEAGMRVLERGGTAVDAAVAIQAMLGLVEPQSSGIGGGSFMLVYDARARRVTAYDGRETAPAGATPDMFLDDNGKPLPFGQAVVSGRATGVPGAVAMLGKAHEDHGRLAWNSLFADAVVRAREGFAVSPRLHRFVTSDRAPQMSQPDARRYFSEEDGTLVDVGDVLKNPAYAETLETIAARGPKALYEGPLAEAVAARTRQAPLPGTLTAADMRAYRVKVHDPLCRGFRTYTVCTPPPPSSGVVLLQALMMLDRTPAIEGGPASAAAWAAMAEAERLMYADRDRWIGDPAFVQVPTDGLVDPAYVVARAALIGERPAATVEAGAPPGAPRAGADRTREPAGTSHFVVVDRWGNAVSMTTTVESIFGSGRMVGGFFLNNQMTDFSFTPTDRDGAPAANAVAPGKRPRSSMSPVIVLDGQRRFVGGLGSPGGSAILSYNLKTLIGIFVWGLHPQAAIDLPNLIARGSVVNGEADKFPPGVVAALAERGIVVKPGSGEDSGVHAIVRRNGVLEGGADPRREGVVRSR